MLGTGQGEVGGGSTSGKSLADIYGGNLGECQQLESGFKAARSLW